MWAVTLSALLLLATWFVLLAVSRERLTSWWRRPHAVTLWRADGTGWS